MGRFDVLKTLAKVGTIGKEMAQKALDLVPSAEEAVKLTGAEREGYLKALEALHGPRDVRASEMGFSPETLYHGSNASSIQEFNQGREGLFGSGTYLTDNPEIASSYATPHKTNSIRFSPDPYSSKSRAEQLADFHKEREKFAPTVYPVKQRKGIMLDMDKPADLELWKKHVPEVLENLPKNPTNGDIYKLIQDDLREQNMHPSEAADITAEMFANMGIDTVQHVGGTRAGKNKLLHNVSIKNKPEDIRSINAAFDPRFKDSGLIAAGAAGVATGLGASAASSDEANAASLPKWTAINKLTQEASAAKPVVKQGGRLIGDNQLAQGQKIVEKLPSSQEYLEKMASLKKAAAIAPSMNSFDSLGQLGEAYSAIRDPIVNATSKVGEAFSDLVRPPFGQSPEQIENERDIAGTVGSMVLDPSNLLAPGAGMAVGAADVGAGMAAPSYPSLMELLKLKRPNINSEEEELPVMGRP